MVHFTLQMTLWQNLFKKLPNAVTIYEKYGYFYISNLLCYRDLRQYKNIIIIAFMNQVVESEKLEQIINKIEGIEAERQEISDLLKDTYSEAKALGFDVKIIKHILKLKKKDKAQLAEEDGLIDLYRGALGI